jgi:hypothetical protein
MIKFVFKRSNYFCLPKVSILQHLELFLFAKCTVYVGSFKCHRTHLTVSPCGNSNIEMSTYFSKSLNLKPIKQPGLTMLMELIFYCYSVITLLFWALAILIGVTLRPHLNQIMKSWILNGFLEVGSYESNSW